MDKKTLMVGACMLPLLTSIPTLTQARKNDKPNFIVIYCDDMGYGDLSCFGNPTIKTPNLDRMAQEGQKWSSFYVGSPVSSPSRACLLTGRLGVRNGMYGNRREVLHPNSPKGLPQSEYTVAELLKTAGYQTACIGKWHLGHHLEEMPRQNGFDHFYGFPFSNDMSRYEQELLGNRNYPYEYLVYEQEQIIDREIDQNDITRRVTSQAVDYIRSTHHKPFFLLLTHPMPHVPVYASDQFKGTSDGGKYGDVIEELDWSTGQILKTLKQEGIDKNTLVVFTSDNGPWLIYKQQAGTAGPLRDGKNTHFEGGFRVPCIIWGGMVDPGHVTEMGSTLDLLPTFCEMAGVDLPTDREYDGTSLLGVLKDSKAHSPRTEFFFYRGDNIYAVRKDNFKLHVLYKPAYNRGQMQVLEKPILYDLNSDPSEHYDVADSHPEVVKELGELLRRHRESVKIAESIFDLPAAK